jgi:nucleotide-binding universal stress UspA family protein
MSVSARKIVVGVDDSVESIAALRWAFRQARATGAAVEAIYAFQVSLPVPYSPTIRVPAEEVAAESKANLDQVIATHLGRDADVKVTTTVVEGRAADVLVDAARGAELLVLGSSRIPRIVGVLAASTDYAVIHSTPCPLVLVPSGPETNGGVT